MRTAMQSHNLKVTTYTSFFRQCKSKIKPWGGWHDHSTLKLSFQRKMNWLRFCCIELCARPRAWGSP